MKITFTIEKDVELEKDGIFKKKEVEMYRLTALFRPTAQENNTISEHPLFKNIVFLEYNEVDKWTTGLILKDKKVEDRTKVISVGNIFDNPTFSFRAYSVPRILELRKLVVEATQKFTDAAHILKRLEGTEEIEFLPNSEKEN